MATPLTDRQQEIKGLLDKGATPREIGEALDITENAVYQHIRRMRDSGHTIKGSGKRAGAKRTPARKPAASKAPAPKPAAPAPSAGASATTIVANEPRAMTPLQAIRARREVINARVKGAMAVMDGASRALKAATESYQKATDELAQLDAAEAALTGKAAPAPAKPKPRSKPAPKTAEVTPAPVDEAQRQLDASAEFDQIVPPAAGNGTDPVEVPTT